ncbi:MAG: prolyl oligopeptidase family serine peptidase [Candidatus Aminicenantes bacterium]|nr:MAG: prolyl oligopeptidase family serine peptidase [Candidatus Aminicenantes bacterium]
MMIQLKIRKKWSMIVLFGLISWMSVYLAAIVPSIYSSTQKKQKEKEKYAETLMRTFTSGEIIELDKIPDNKHFSRLIKDQAKHEGISEDELRKVMLEYGVMKYVIHMLRDGQISLTEYVNLRPDIHWVEALRMAYVGGGLTLGEELGKLLAGEVTESVQKLRQDKEIKVREIAYRSSVEDLYPLYAEVAFDPNRKKAPVIVLVHGDVPGTRMIAIAGAYAYAKKGFFAIAPSQRGRDGSAGEGDVFCREIYDIYDAVEYVKQNYPDYIDPTNINITGGSAGGMASIAAAVRFPDYFRMSIPYYGSPDTGHWLRLLGLSGKTFEQWKQGVRSQGWPEGSITLFRNIIQALGGMLHEVPDKVMARNLVLGVINNPYTQIHMIWDMQDGAAPSITMRNKAYHKSAVEMGYTNVHIHYSKVGDSIRYLHWITPDNATAQRFFIPQILAETYPPPILADAGRLIVLGFVKTKQFLVWLGQGDDAVARVDYQVSFRRSEFRFRRLSQDKNVRGKLVLPNKEKKKWTVKVNRKVVMSDVDASEITVDFGLDDVVVVALQKE